jgi:hypothetical protein
MAGKKNMRRCLAFYFFVLYFLSAMHAKYPILLIAILVLAAQPLSALSALSALSGERVLAQEDEKRAEAPIQTDKKAYKVAVTQQSVKFAVNYSYANHTGGVVFLPSCKKPYRPSLEKKVESRWTPVVDSMGLECGGPPVRIGPGKTYRGSFAVEAFLPGNDRRPQLKIDVKEIEGVYRLVHVFSGQNRIFPLEERASNEFNLTR